MADGDLVRKITISATGENIDQTKRSVESLKTSTDALSSSTDAYKKQTDALNTGQSDYYVNKAAQVGLLAAGFYALNSAAGSASQGVGSLYTAVVGTLGAIASYLPNKLVEAWDLGKAKLQEYVDLNDKAGRNSTDFYQKLVRGATDAKVSVDLLLTSVDSLNQNLAPKLDGSAGQNKIDELLKRGNFQGNTGIDALRSATTDEERLTALTSFYRQAQEANQNLAAQEVIRATAGDALTKALSKDAMALDVIKSKMDFLKATDIINQADIDRAAGLKVQMDAAQKILSDRLKPDAQTLTTLIGVEMYAGWVRVVGMYAQAVQWMDRLFASSEKVAGVKPDSAWDNFFRGVASWGLQGQSKEQVQRLEEAYGISSDPKDIAMTTARNRLGSQLQNPANVIRNTADVQALSDKLRPDDSKSKVDSAAYDRAVDALQKYIETTNAAASSVDATAAAQERLKAIAQLTAAGMRDGLTQETAKLKAEMSGLGEKAGAAADALAKARIESTIKRDTATALLSPEDVAIASQLRDVYPKVSDALNSTYASQIRFNNALRDANDTGRQISESFGSDFTSALRSGSSAWDAFSKAGTNALNTIADKLLKMQIDKLWTNAFGGTSGTSLLSFFGGSAGELPNYGTSAFVGPLPGHASGTNDAVGGWSTVGENGPERMYIPKGATIVPHGMRDPGDGGSYNVSVPITIDATGADPAALARLQTQLASLKATLPNTIVSTVKKAQAGRTL